MSRTTQMRIEISVFGDALVSGEFSEVIGVTATSTGAKGAEIPPLDTPAIISQEKWFHKDTFWEFSSEQVETLFLDEISDSFLDSFATEKLFSAKNYIEEKQLETRIIVIVKIKGETTPSIYFNKRLLDFANLIGAEISVDLYANLIVE